jgi:acetyl esterase/lipase
MLRSLPLRWRLAICLWSFVLCCGSVSADGPAYSREADVIYGRKHGVALTLEVLKPKQNANGLGIIFAVSGGWFSGPPGEQLNPIAVPLLANGYTVFAVVHGSQPKYTIPEILEDMHRAARFVRFHAKKYGIDPDRIGMTGGSAGGHLSLMQGTAGTDGKLNAKDPIDRVSSRVQAVACLFPPTDFLNYGKPGEDAIGRGTLANYAAAFDFREFDKEKKKFVTITDEAKIVEWGRKISPITHVSAKSAPTFIIHGDADLLVPIQQAETFLEKLKEAGVETKLVVKPAAAHGWGDLPKDVEQFVGWFDAHLKKGAPTAAPAVSAEAPAGSK